MAAPVPPRRTGGVRKVTSMRPPLQRPGPNRAQTATPTLTGRASPSGSAVSSRSRTPKRRIAPEPYDQDAGEETNINVVVRCRGRNDREVRENSGVVVSTDGIKGKKVDLSMGPSALSNKTYSFDNVFSPAADQGMIFDEVVTPILDEVLAGFNCTIFAYGQTGTGKTYTMSGDIADILPIPDGAGIIPRVLHYLFDKLGDDGSEKREHNVKCSFIELYNEELRDLLAPDEGAKLKIYDEANKHGRTTTLVQGMEESHIRDASKGIQLLREGSHKRQVAATKCNDLSSRSHTVFTVTVYMKRTTDTGEDYVSSGKLNLVDLAGSENIQRSGAENKRAAEAGLINKSLLTLGRVINALVEKNSHIPYRESKLTRLLQDSLGGRTKTCIIATLSPAKSNLEETISTLDYAFRAKNIRNKPQVNQMVSKKTLLKEFTAEIEKLKSELIATRQRNGVYLTAESYEAITIESESRRILSEEQRDKIETLEVNIRNKVQELFNLTTNFHSLRRDNEQTRALLDGTKGVLERTEIVLAHTRRHLAEETHLRKAHEETEEKLAAAGQDLLGTLETTTNHVDRLHSKLKRRSELQSLNRTKWTDSQSHVADVTATVEHRIKALRERQENLVSSLSNRMREFVSDEMQQLQSSQALIHEQTTRFEQSQAEVNSQTDFARDNMDAVLEEVTGLRNDVKEKVGAGLNDLSSAAQRISASIATELNAFQDQLQDSYASLGREFKTLFEDLIRQMNEQQAQAQRLREQISEANATFVEAGNASQAQLRNAMEQERQTAAAERAALLAKVTDLINGSATTQESRLDGYVESASKRIKLSQDEYQVTRQTYCDGMNVWNSNGHALIDSAIKSRETVKARLKGDWSSASEQTTKLVENTNAVHSETIRIVDGQMAQMDHQLHALDDIVNRVRTQNEEHQMAHTKSLAQLAQNVEESYEVIGKHFETSFHRTEALDRDIHNYAVDLDTAVDELSANSNVCAPLQQLREDVTAAQITEYSITGETPAKTQYVYPTALPRTEVHEKLLDRMRGGDRKQNSKHAASPTKSPSKRSPIKCRSSPVKGSSSPTKTTIFADAPPTFTLSAPTSRPSSSASASQTLLPELRELDVNVNIPASTSAAETSLADVGADGGLTKQQPFPLKRQLTHPTGSIATESAIAGYVKRVTRTTMAGVAEGRENLPPNASAGLNVVGAGAGLSASVGPGGRRLRSRGSD